MEIGYTLPLDADGYLRRECPHCEQEFKWHHGPTPNAPEDFVYDAVYWCPRCGQSAANDQWFTQEQVEFQQGTLEAAAPDLINDMLADAFKPSRRSGITFKQPSRQGSTGQPDPLVEPDDMVIVAPPCHSWEPVKVPEDAEIPFHCLICGAAYAV
ncbi:hypothetical protein E3O55_11985 [Cryobacterium sp. MDB1-18-2]|uniref:hypothetical protein n=1 Tax=unclassified Cryobacterium TaxID=2649013 RepID=UPI00106CB99E|nr:MULTISPECIES: hypothetical protein [unclassified Cryobacterium]TFC27614.1 hypothetical protein E3O55_11985 [Cryobacterium sp. MDB1-18-2]TFC45853.1 hypothetical protein E3O50_02515 [Cryobacterium sp. MDB1-18-1]